MNHSGDTNKMVDTPRTEAEVNRQKCWSDDLITIDANFACQLERELNAANKRIQSLIEERDRANRLAEWKSFTSGNVQQAFDFARQLERELNAANDRIKRLEDWKEWALAVEREWNANAIATMLGGQPGESQRKVIQREVPKLLARIKRLEEAGDALKAAGYFGGWADAVNKWIKAKEAKP